MGSDSDEEQSLLGIRRIDYLSPTPPSLGYNSITSSTPVPGKNEALGRPRIQSTHSGIFIRSYDEDSVRSTVSTSYGPVVVETGHILRSYGLFLGLCLAFISAILFTGNNFLFQYLRNNATDMLLIRGILQISTLGTVILFTSCCKRIFPTTLIDSLFVLGQGLLNGVRVGLTFLSMKYLPIGDALTIKLTEPIWTLLIAKIFLKTPMGLWKLAFSVSVFVGIVLCAQPPFIFDHFKISENVQPSVMVLWSSRNSEKFSPKDNGANVTSHSERKSERNLPDSWDYYLGLSCALGTGVCGAVANILVSRCISVSSVVLTFWSGIGSAVTALLYGFLVDQEDIILYKPMSLNFLNYLNLIFLASLGLLGFLLLTRALQLIPPTTVAVIRVIEIVFAYVLQSVILNEVPNCLAIIGSSLVILSVIGITTENIILAN